MSFFVSSKPNRASVMVRSQRDMLMAMNNRTGMFSMRAQLAAWYYIQEDVKDVPEFVRYIYAYARKCIENSTGMKATDLAYGSVPISQEVRCSGTAWQTPSRKRRQYRYCHPQ